MAINRDKDRDGTQLSAVKNAYCAYFIPNDLLKTRLGSISGGKLTDCFFLPLFAMQNPTMLSEKLITFPSV